MEGGSDAAADFLPDMTEAQRAEALERIDGAFRRLRGRGGSWRFLMSWKIADELRLNRFAVAQRARDAGLTVERSHSHGEIIFVPDQAAAP